MLREVKKIFVPDGLMNPGKIISDDADVFVRNLRAQKTFLPERLEADMHLAEDELAVELERCYGCGLCLNREAGLRFCPVYRAMGEEILLDIVAIVGFLVGVRIMIVLWRR